MSPNQSPPKGMGDPVKVWKPHALLSKSHFNSIHTFSIKKWDAISTFDLYNILFYYLF